MYRYITINKEDYEYWEDCGHVLVRSLGPSNVFIEVPADCCMNLNGSIIPILLTEYIKENILKNYYFKSS